MKLRLQGRKTIDSYKFRSSLISPHKFKLLGPHESPVYPLQMGEEKPDILQEVTEWQTKMLKDACQPRHDPEGQKNTQSLRWSKLYDIYYNF